MYELDDEEYDNIKKRLQVIEALNTLRDEGYDIKNSLYITDINQYYYDEINITSIRLILKIMFGNNVEANYFESHYQDTKSSLYGYKVYTPYEYDDEESDNLDYYITPYRFDIKTPLIEEYTQILKENKIKAFNTDANEYLRDIREDDSDQEGCNITFSAFAEDYSCIYIFTSYGDVDIRILVNSLLSVINIMKETIKKYKSKKIYKYKVTYRDYKFKEIVKKHVIKNRNKYVNKKKKVKYLKKRLKERGMYYEIE